MAGYHRGTGAGGWDVQGLDADRRGTPVRPSGQVHAVTQRGAGPVGEGGAADGTIGG